MEIPRRERIRLKSRQSKRRFDVKWGKRWDKTNGYRMRVCENAS